MPVRNRKPEPSRREQAADLRALAVTERAGIDEAERALEERRQADEAGRLEAKAHQLEIEQESIDKAAKLREQTDAAEASADELDREAARLNGEMLEAAIRAARFERQIAGEIAERRQELERRRSEASQTGDADTLMDAERDLALLPTVEAHLREQADAADARASELNGQAGEVESRAHESRGSAAALRRWADTDPLAPGAPPLPDSEQATRARALLDSGARRAAREVGLRAVRALPDPGDHEEAAAVFERAIEAHRVARARALHAQDVAQLDEVAHLVGQVREATAAEAGRRRHAPVDVFFTATIAGAEREALMAAVARYRERLGRELPRCRDLATNETFGLVDRRLHPDRFAEDVDAAAARAEAELAAERAALEA